MLPNLTDLCSKVIDEIVAHERAEVESETNALLGLSWDACGILEAGSIKESVYYTNKRDYIDEEWYKIITGAPAVASENATRLHKLFDSKRIEVKHIIQTASQPSSAMNCIPESLNKQLGRGDTTNMKSILPCSMVIIFVTIFTVLGGVSLALPWIRYW